MTGLNIGVWSAAGYEKPRGGGSKLPAYVRYTEKENIKVFKGQDYLKNKGKVYSSLCKKVCDSLGFLGSSFSGGDAGFEKIGALGKGERTPGNMKRLGLVHHLTLVQKQVSKYSSKIARLHDRPTGNNLEQKLLAVEESK